MSAPEMLTSSGTSRTPHRHTLDGVPRDFSTPISQILRVKLKHLVRSSLLDS